MLGNDEWMENFLNSHYVVKTPTCFDHCPIVLLPGHREVTHYRFLFKNYWSNLKDFWCILLSIFTGNTSGRTTFFYTLLLKQLKHAIKSKKWANSNLMANYLSSLYAKQEACINQLSLDCNIDEVSLALKNINHRVVAVTSH